MARNQIYFGTRNYMQWVPAPDRNVPRSPSGYVYNSSRLDGSAGSRRSIGSHREYEFTWSLAHGESIDPVLGYANGDYGDGPFYWVDPWAADTNILPDAFASPGKHDTRNALYQEPTPANSNGYPTTSIQWGDGDNSYSPPTTTVWVPVPDGYTLHVGAHGQETGTDPTRGVFVTPGSGSPVKLDPIIETSTVRTNYSYTGPGGGPVRVPA